MTTHSARPQVVGLTVAIALAISAVVAALVTEETGEDTLPVVTSSPLTWASGACVRRSGTLVSLVTCDRAGGRVRALAPTPPDCPPDTDEFVSLAPSRTACVRNAAAPHPGDPGEGGGILRAGDCVALRGGEQPCAGEGWYGRVTGVVEAVGDCPGGTVEAYNLTDHAVICLGRGGQVIATGDCLARPAPTTSASRLMKVPCSARNAWAKVTGRVSSGSHCPEGSDHYLRPVQKSGVICLRVTSRDPPAA